MNEAKPLYLWIKCPLGRYSLVGVGRFVGAGQECPDHYCLFEEIA